MSKLVPLVSFLWVLQLALASCADSYSGPSPYEYGLDNLFDNIANTDNLVAGWRQYEDTLVYSGNLTVPGIGYDQDYLQTELQYPPNGEQSNATITYIISQEKTGRDTKAYLTKGGIGFNNAVIGYTYNQHFGLDHWIEIYGHY